MALSINFYVGFGEMFIEFMILKICLFYKLKKDFNAWWEQPIYEIFIQIYVYF